MKLSLLFFDFFFKSAIDFSFLPFKLNAFIFMKIKDESF